MMGNTIETATLLVVSRDSGVIRLLRSMGESNRWQLDTATNVWKAMERVESGAMPDLLLLDIPQVDSGGLHILQWLRRLRPALPIVLIGHPGEVDKKQEGIRLGAKAYLVRPLDERLLEMVIRHHLFTSGEAINSDIPSKDIELISDGIYFLGISPIMRRLRAQAALLAETNVPILILGEGGSGKETTARLIHKLSVRSGFEFTKVNCAALPGDQLESELYGSKGDGTTGTMQARSGKLESCAKGTILLDEITEMPMRMQANLMQVLHDKQFVRPGTSVSIEVDVRVLAASTTNMEHVISKNRLRDDLYDHLSTYTMHVPPLRERKEEMPLLLRHFMHQFSRHYGVAPRDFTPAIVEACQVYSWPGNLRELEHFVKRYLMRGDQEVAFDESRPDLGEAIQAAASTTPTRSIGPASSFMQPRGVPTNSDSLRSMVKSVTFEAERRAISAALQKTGWNRKAAARLLKISYRTLLYKIDQYQIRSSDPYQN